MNDWNPFRYPNPEQPGLTERPAPAGSRLLGAPDEVVDLRGAFVAPAFVDAHVHVLETGLALSGVDLSSATSLGAVLDRVERAVARGADPVLGHGWDETRWREGRPPTRAELDRAASGRAVYLARADLHSAVVSSALAERAGCAGAPGCSACLRSPGAACAV